MIKGATSTSPESMMANGIAKFALSAGFQKKLFPDDCFQKDGEDGMSLLKLASEYVSYLKPFLKPVPSLPEDSLQSEIGKTFDAIGGFLDRFQHVKVRKVLETMFRFPESKYDINRLLPKEVQPIAHTILTWQNVGQELKELGEAEHSWTFLTKKLSLFESLSAAVNDKLMSATVFQDAKDQCNAYVKSFIEACQLALTEIGPGLAEQLKGFIEKYQKVGECAESWHMLPVSYVFEPENEEDCNADLEKVEITLRELTELCSDIKLLMAHTSCNSAFQEVIQSARKFHSETLAMMSSTRKLATILMVSDVMLKEVIDKDSLQKVLGLCRDGIGTSKEDLPVKMRKIMADLDGKAKSQPQSRKRTPPEDTSGTAPKRAKKDQGPKQPKEVPKEKEKKRKADKK